MAEITLRNVAVTIPIYDYSAQKIIRKLRFRARPNAQAPVKSVRALQNLDLDIPSGTRLGVIGPNGAGKSTLLRLLTGVYSPTEGSISRSGQVASLLDMSFGIEPDLTGRESIELRASILGISAKKIRANMDEIVEFSGLGQFIDLPTRTYSSGMFIRLAFSIVTSLEPEILVMDEWLSVGDSDFRTRAERRLEELVSKTDILVLASHSRDLIESTCNVVLYLERGRIAGLGAPQETCSQYFGG